MRTTKSKFGFVYILCSATVHVTTNGYFAYFLHIQSMDIYTFLAVFRTSSEVVTSFFESIAMSLLHAAFCTEVTDNCHCYVSNCLTTNLVQASLQKPTTRKWQPQITRKWQASTTNEWQLPITREWQVPTTREWQTLTTRKWHAPTTRKWQAVTSREWQAPSSGSGKHRHPGSGKHQHLRGR